MLPGGRSALRFVSVRTTWTKKLRIRLFRLPGQSVRNSAPNYRQTLKPARYQGIARHSCHEKARKLAIARMQPAIRADVGLCNFWKAGRGDRIRTYDLRYPKPSRYQAAPRPEHWRCLQVTAIFEKRQSRFSHTARPRLPRMPDDAAHRQPRCPAKPPCRH